MAVTNQGWAVRNSARKYPLDDTASTVGDNGSLLPESFIVDCNIWAPEISFDDGRKLRYLYIGSASVTENQVSFTILGTAGPVRPADGGEPGISETPFTPIGYVSVSRDSLVPYKNYAITPSTDGVTGWVMFGQVTDSEPFNILFSSPSQSMLAPKVGRFYSGLPTPGITMGSLRNLLVGDVELVVSSPIAVAITEREIENVGTRNVIEIYMAEDDQTPSKETMESYAGDCYPRPESDTCNKQPITSISSVEPDDNGRIFVEFEGVSFRIFDDGVCIDSEQGLSDACAGVSIATSTVPCRIDVPYTNNFSDVSDFSVQSGYLYVDGGNLYVFAGGYESAAINTCLVTLPDDVDMRAFTLDIVSDGGVEVGQFFCDAGGHRIVVLMSGAVFVEDKNTLERTQLGTAHPGDPMTVLANIGQTIGGVAIPDDYWKPSGKTGIITYGAGEATFSQYGVVDA